MPSLSTPVRQVFQLVQVVLMCAADGMRLFTLCMHSRSTLAAENLFLRRQLALYQERDGKLRRVTTAWRFTLVWLSHWFDWQAALTIVRPETFKRWRRQRIGVPWKGHVHRGRPPIPPDLQALIRQMARENLTWGQQRIANELRLKLGLQASPRTVRKYMPSGRDRGPDPHMQGQRWRTFMRNHTVGLLKSDLFTVLSRGWHVFATRVIERLQRRQGLVAAGEWRRATPSEAPSIVFRRPTRSLCLEDSAYPAEVPRVAGEVRLR
jgi:putative transposase